MVLPPSPSARKVRKHLSADALYALLRTGFRGIPEHRQGTPIIPLTDALMSAFAMFSLKDPSLLAFDERRSDRNLKALFGIGQIPSDTQMREILDPLDPEHLRPLFGDVFRQLQRGKALEPFEFYEGCYLLSLDGTGYFSSQKIHCPLCQVKEHQSGAVSYEHQMLAAVIVHPDLKEVIPLAPEPIRKQDGSTKNDCERNAARRLLEKIRREHPRLKLIVVEDGLSSNGPHVRDLIDYGVHFTWITDLHITCRNAWCFARGGRARWHIENETFNTLKNQGYHFEHNYGHGEQNLSVVFAMLMMLAFLVDQAQQLCCGLFRAVWKKLGSKRALWDNLRSHFRHFRFRSMRHLYEVILDDRAKEVPLPTWDTS
jgi:hypothetical protein